MKAVILAAGQGVRIRDHHTLPKGLIEVEGQAIIERSIALLRQHGIDNICLITGYCQEYYNAMSQQQAGLDVVFNPHFADYASLYSLYCAKDWVDDDILVLESDILYEARAIDTILNSTEPNATLVSGWTQSSDEIYVEAHDQTGQLINMSKQRAEVDEVHLLGEFVGISKLSLQGFQQLVAILDNDAEQLQRGCYEEQGLVSLAQHASLHCHKIPDLYWCEIDNLFHLERAKRLYPNIAGIATTENSL